MRISRALFLVSGRVGMRWLLVVYGVYRKDAIRASSIFTSKDIWIINVARLTARHVMIGKLMS
jgi:hypothetical protein